MAVDFSLLVTDLSIQNQIVDKFKSTNVSQSASGAQVFFFKTDKITPKNVYIDTGDPQNQFIVSPNPITLNTAGAFDQELYFYFFDESVDNPTENDQELYYIQVINTDNVTIYETNNFVLNPITGGGGGGATTNIVNLAPSYALDVLDRNNENAQYAYNNARANFITEIGNYPALSFLWLISSPDFGNFYYTFTDVAIGTLPGDPYNYINLIQENFSTSQTNCFFAFPICQHPELVGSMLTFQFLAQDQSATAVTNLNIGILRGPPMNVNSNLINWSLASVPINVGSVTLDTTFSLKTITFIVPSEILSPPASAATYMTIGLPLDQNFNIALTGFYVYQGQNESLTITRDNLGNRYSRVFSQSMNSFLLSGGQNFRSLNQPIVRSEQQGGFNFQDRTGIFFQRALDIFSYNTNFGVVAQGQNVVKGYSYEAGGGVPSGLTNEGRSYQLLGDRFLDKYAAVPLGKIGDNSFLTSNVTATSFTVRTVLQHASHSPWISNSGVLTITTITGPSQHIVTAAVDVGIPERVIITNVASYVAFTRGYRADPANGNNYTIANVAANVYIDYFGTITAGPPNPGFTFNPTGGFASGTIFGGGATPAVGFIQFPPGAVNPNAIQTTSTFIPAGVGFTQYLNCLQFLSPQQAGFSQITNPPAYAIQFKVDNAGQNVPVSQTLLTVNFPSASLVSGASLASAMVAILNSADEYIFTFSGVPANGDNFLFSSTYKDFIGIFWQTNQTQPINPILSRPAIYIEIAPGASIQDVVNATNAAFTNLISSIPTPGNLGITVGRDLSLFMEA